MAAPDVENLLEKIKHLFFYDSIEILVSKEVVEMLENSIRLFKAFIEDNPYKFEEMELEISYSETVKEIRKVVWEAEDLIDSLVEGEDEIDYSERVTDTRKALHGVAEEAESIGAKVVHMYDRIGAADIPNSLRIHYQTAPQPHLINRKPRIDFKVEREFVVGFKEEAEKLIGYLMEETEGPDIISIVGMPGIGKTTLAWKVFQDPTIQNKFPCRIWLDVSSECRRRNIVLDLLKKFYPYYNESESSTTASDVADTLDLILDSEKEKLFIVIDDVQVTSDWEDIILALPTSVRRGKILITSRHEEMVLNTIRTRSPHKLCFLSDRESWLLLQYEVFGQTHCPSELKDLGKLIAKQCNGIPLAIVVMGGILAYHCSSRQDMHSTRKSWKVVYEQLRMLYLNKEDPLKFLEQIVAVSYDKLPYHLRACFLYLGMFPKGFKIPTWKLTLMWIAEGFIPEKEGINMEETAEKYLDELIGLNLVRIDKTTIEGKAKTCRIDEAIHDFCQREAATKRENLLRELKISDQGIFEGLVDIKGFHRLCIHHYFWDFVLSLNPYGPHIRSIVCFSLEEVDLPLERISGIKKLRVLEGEQINFSKLPSDFYQLVHLKYISLFLDSNILPLVLSNLRNVETLIVNTKSPTLEIKADMWSMTHLRHLKTNASASLPKVGKRNLENTKGGEKFQTLGIISPQSCKKEFFGRLRCLKKLTIGGRLAILFFRSRTVSFDHLGELHNLEKLKLLNDRSDDGLPGLPPPDKFPPRLRNLTLSYTKINWAEMHILGKLENLKVLKLKDKAFMGEVWEVADDGFRHLEILKIDLTDLTTWVASGHHFPNLRCLELRHCSQLKEVPVQLADIPTFQALDLHQCSISADTSALLIRELKMSKTNDFKLGLFPDWYTL